MAKYDSISSFYLAFVETGLATPYSSISVGREAILSMVGDVSGLMCCDVACGEGHLVRALATRGATATGVDLSAELLTVARQKAPTLTFIHDDAQTLATIPSRQFQLVTSNLALMDIPDLQATFRSIARILQPNGRFVFSILHPCFESPFNVAEPPVVLDENENYITDNVFNYTKEGYWTSGGDGIRGQVGAHHRMLSTYINTLLEVGFVLEQMQEPTIPEGDYSHWTDQRSVKLPYVLAFATRKVGA